MELGPLISLENLTRWERAEQLAATIALAPAAHHDPRWRALAARTLNLHRKAGPDADLKILSRILRQPCHAPEVPEGASPRPP